jgi:hypothetical protein
MKKIVFAAIVIISIIAILILGYFFWPINVDNINNCNSDSDCIIVKAGYCGNAKAINENYLDVWNRHLAKEAIKLKGVQCEPTQPLSIYEAACIESLCDEKIKGEYIE